jgi:EmrB/QacA subfamily drug resistance transporter
LILGICCLSLLLVGMDVTIVNVALPAIQHNLQAPLSGLQWVIDAYTLVVASLLMLSGSLSDRYGRRRTFLLGLSVFTGGSVLCSFAPSIGVLIGARALQGLGASMLNPVALSIITNVFQDPKDRARAIGIWGAVFGMSLALGPVVGGALTQSVGWRAIFLINLPIGILAVLLTLRFVPESKADHARAIDPVGQLLVFSALLCLTYAVIEGPHVGWSSGKELGLFFAAGGSLMGLLFYEPRRREPLVELSFFRSVPFSAATIIAVCTFGSFSALLFLNTLYLQQVRGFTPFHTGLTTMPMALMIMLCAPLSGRLLGSQGTRPSLLAAGSTMLLGTLLMTQLQHNSSLVLLLSSYSLFGIGMGMVNPAISNVAVSGMPRAQAGVAAAIASTSRQVGASMGVAIAGTVLNTSKGLDFARATHPVWWGTVACSALILVLGWATNTEWAQATTRNV